MKYDSQNPFEKLKDNEPWFFLRAQDELSVPTLSRYAEMLKAELGAHNKQCIEIDELIARFADWQKENRTKLPD